MYQFEDDDINFEEINHKYTLLSDPTLDFISCTEFVESFFEPFEPERIATKLVNKIPKYQI